MQQRQYDDRRRRQGYLRSIAQIVRTEAVDFVLGFRRAYRVAAIARIDIAYVLQVVEFALRDALSRRHRSFVVFDLLLRARFGLLVGFETFTWPVLAQTLFLRVFTEIELLHARRFLDLLRFIVVRALEARERTLQRRFPFADRHRADEQQKGRRDAHEPLSKEHLLLLSDCSICTLCFVRSLDDYLPCSVTNLFHNRREQTERERTWGRTRARENTLFKLFYLLLLRAVRTRKRSVCQKVVGGINLERCSTRRLRSIVG